jgi:hypothetical protein
MSFRPRGVLTSIDGWSSGSLQITTASGTDTWVPTDDRATLLDSAVALLIWANSASRPWFGTATFTIGLFDLDPWFGFQLISTVSTTYAPNSVLQGERYFDWPSSGQTSTTIYSVLGIRSTCYCETDVGDWAKRVQSSGGISRSGSFMVDSQVYSLRVPRVEALCDEGQLAALGEAIRDASDPRWFYVVRPVVRWTSPPNPYVRIEPGRIDRQRVNATTYRVTFEALG